VVSCPALHNVIPSQSWYIPHQQLCLVRQVLYPTSTILLLPLLLPCPYRTRCSPSSSGNPQHAIPGTLPRPKRPTINTTATSNHPLNLSCPSRVISTSTVTSPIGLVRGDGQLSTGTMQPYPSPALGLGLGLFLFCFHHPRRHPIFVRGIWTEGYGNRVSLLGCIGLCPWH
jgi:hypothetical protein